MFTFRLQTPISQRKPLVIVAPANKMSPLKHFQFMYSSEFEFSPSEVSSIQYCVHIPYKLSLSLNQHIPCLGGMCSLYRSFTCHHFRVKIFLCVLRFATLEPSVNLMYFTFCRFYRESDILQHTHHLY